MRTPSTDSRSRRGWAAERVALWTAAALIAVAAVVMHVYARRPIEVPADHAEVTFRVEGMHCGVYCPIRVGEALKGVDGLYRTLVDVSRGEVTVLYDAERVTLRDLRARVDAVPDYTVQKRTHP